MTNPIRSLSFVLVLLAGVVAAGCNESATQEASTEGKSTSAPVVLDQGAVDREKPAPEPEAKVARDGAEGAGHRGWERGKRGLGGRHGGPEMGLFFEAQKLADLSESQKTSINSLLESMKPSADEHARMKGGMQGMRAFDKALADQVRGGKIDRAALLALRPAVPDHGARAQAHQDALKQLHALLTPAQRSALVAQLTARFDEKRGHGRHHGHGQDAADTTGREEKGSPFDHGMFSALRLTDEQKAKLGESMTAAHKSAHDDASRNDEGKAKAKAFLTSFASDSFDPSTMAPRHENGAHGDTMFEHHIDMIEGLMAVLSPDQRATLADELEQGPRDHHRAPHAE